MKSLTYNKLPNRRKIVILYYFKLIVFYKFTVYMEKIVNVFVYKCTLKHVETVHMKTRQGILKKILVGLLKLH